MALEPLSERLGRLNKSVRDSKDLLNVDGLLDAVQAVYNDCNFQSLTQRSKNLESFKRRYQPAATVISNNRLTPQDFQLLKVIGSGAFGVVQLVRMKENRKVYAMKILNKFEMIRRSDTAFFWEERDIMAFTESEWIVQLHFAFQDVQNLYMVMDYMAGGDIVSLMSRYEIPEDWARFYCAELVLALDAVHAMGYVHRDVKPDNMLLDARGHLKLADFGTCMRMDEKGKVKCETAVGTPDYISPEVLASQGKVGYYGRECDWWSVGVVLYEMIVGDTPFYADSVIGTYGKIMNHKSALQFPADVPMSASAMSIIRKFLDDGEHRLGVNGSEDIRKEPFFRQDQWTWEKIRSCVPPVVPELKSETDTTYFDEIDDLPQPQQKAASPMEFQGNHLPFVGFTYYKDVNILDDATGGKSPSGEGRSAELEMELSKAVQAQQELEANLQTMKNNLLLAEEQIKEKKKELGQLQRDTEKQANLMQIELKAAVNKAKEHESDKHIAEARLAEVQSELEISRINAPNASLRGEIEQLRGRLETEDRASATLRESNLSLKQDLSVQRSLVERQEQRNKELQNTLRELEGELSSKKDQWDREKQAKSELERQCADLTRTVSEHKDSVASLKTKLLDSQENLQRAKRAQTEAEKIKLTLDATVKNTQQRLNQLTAKHEQCQQKMDEQKRLSSSSAEKSEYKEVLGRLEEEATARKAAERQVETAEHRVSMLEFDMKQKDSELERWKQQVSDLDSQIQSMTEKCQQQDKKLRKQQDETKEQLLKSEMEQRKSLAKLKYDQQQLEDTIHRLMSESRARDDTLKETMESLELERKQASELRTKMQNIQKPVVGGSVAGKDTGQLREEISELNSKLTKALEKKAAAEAKLADLERWKLMIELDIKEIIARHKMEVTEKMAWASKMKDQMMLSENKLKQKTLANEELQDNLQRALSKLKELQADEEHRDEERKKLRQQFETERVLKVEAVNKLAEIMYKRGRSGTSQRPEPRKAHERELRKLRGELQQETQRHKATMERYHQQIEEIQHQIQEEQQLRMELQVQLNQSEAKLKQMQKGMSSGGYVSNGPSAETEHGSGGISPIVERETLNVQVPKGNDARKKGWKDMFVVLSYTSRKLLIYEKEDDMGSGAVPYLTLEFPQIYNVRLLKPGEHESVRVKANDAKRVLLLAYIDQAIDARKSNLPVASEDSEGVIQVRGHHFSETRNSSRSSCDVCGKTLPLSIFTGGIYECKHCHMKCHKDDTEKSDLIQPCVAGEQDQSKLLIMIRSDEDREKWLERLSQIMLTGTPRATSPFASARSLLSATSGPSRGGSVRFGGKRPGSAQPQSSPNANLGGRTKSVSSKKASGPGDRGGGVKSHLEFVRSMDSDSASQ